MRKEFEDGDVFEFYEEFCFVLQYVLFVMFVS